MSRHIILVASGMGLVGKGFGPVIDSFDNVMRFNNWKTKGYEQDVGQKFTHYGYYRPNYPGPPPKGVKEVWEYTKNCLIRSVLKDGIWDQEVVTTKSTSRISSVLKYPNGQCMTTGIRILSHVIDHFDVVFTAGWYKTLYDKRHFNDLTHIDTVHSLLFDRMYLELLISKRKIVEID